MINQGDIYWVDLGEPEGSEPGFAHPNVVIQNNIFNHSQINTTIVCGLTTNLKRAAVPGNVLLDTGEGGLPRQSVVLVSQVFTVDKSHLHDFVGTLSKKRIHQVLDGLSLLTEPKEAPR